MRDPAFLRDVPEELMWAFYDTNAQSLKKLSRLKQKIKQHPFVKYMDNYPAV